MSVPLPSPSIISTTTSKTIPRSRPSPITTGSSSPPSPQSSLLNRASGLSAGGQSTRSGTGTPGNGDNWRDRNSQLNGNGTGVGVGSLPKSAGNGLSGQVTARVGPERTVGGFEKRENRSGSVGGAGVGVSGSLGSGSKNDDKDSEAKAALSHVPCRFFKAGACTAGASCQFSHAAPEPGKKEICQWYLKGNCKFGHKCALAHVRPGEPLSMDRKNKREAQKELRERSEVPSPRIRRETTDENVSSPVPIKSAVSASFQGNQLGGFQSPPPRIPPASSPMREPYGPPSGTLAGSPSSGFGHSRPPLTGFASSPSRPSPLSASFSGKTSVPGPLNLKSAATTSLHSPLRPPVTAGAGTVFSSSFSHSALTVSRSDRPMSASYVDPIRNIWARHESAEEPLSPARRPITSHPIHSLRGGLGHAEDTEDEEHGEDLLPSSLNELLTPLERARRMSRRDSQESFSGSPSRTAFLASNGSQHLPSPWHGSERLAQSAGATMGPAGFLQGLWSAEGEDARKGSGQNGSEGAGNGAELAFKLSPVPSAAPTVSRQSLLTQQRTPISQVGFSSFTSPPQPSNIIGERHSVFGAGIVPDTPYIIRDSADPSSPTAARVLKEHAPGQSLPQGLAAGLSRLHLRGASGPRVSSALGSGTPGTPGSDEGIGKIGKKEEHEDEEEGDLFTMDH